MANKKPAGDQTGGPQDTNSDGAKLAQYLRSRRHCPDCGGPTSPALCDPSPEDRARGIAAVITPARHCIRLADGVCCGRPHRIAAASQAIDDALAPIHHGAVGRTLTLDPDSPLWKAVRDSWSLAISIADHRLRGVEVLDVQETGVGEHRGLQLQLVIDGKPSASITAAVQRLAQRLKGAPVEAVELCSLAFECIATAEVQR